MVHDAAHRTEDVLSCLREAVAISLETGDLMNASVGLCNLGHNLFVEKRLDEAEDAFAQAAEAAAAGRNQHAEAMATGGLADISRARGDTIKAWNQYEHAIQLMDIVGHKAGVLRLRIRHAALMADGGDVEQAVAVLKECVAQGDQAGAEAEAKLAREDLDAIQERARAG